MNRLRERVADALRRDARNLRHREMDDAALVWVEGTELLIDAGLFDLLGKKLRDLAELDILAFAVRERVDEDALPIGQRAAVGHIDDMLQCLQRLASMAHQDFSLVAVDIEARTVWRLLKVHRRLD